MKYIFSILLLVFSVNLLAQKISQSEVSAASRQYSGGSLNFSYTIGGVFSGSISNGNTLTQGFLQAERVSNNSTQSTEDLKLQVFPNPVNENLYIRFFDKKNEKIMAEVFDLSGKKILQKKFYFGESQNSKHLKLNLSDLPSSNYLISVKGDNMQKIISVKISKK